MRSILFALLALVPAPALADKAFDSSGTHDCSKDPNVFINTGEGTFSFTGKCEKIFINGGENKVTIESVAKLSVNGAENTIDIDAADKIAVNGADNKISYKRGISGKLPKIASTGTGNKISQVK